MNKINKKAQGSLLWNIVMGLSFFMFGILIIGLLFPDIAVTKSSVGLDCSNQTISSGNKLACLGIDSTVPIWIISIILIGGGAVVLKLVNG